ncbi:MAG TPA: tRNA lysidine(34) synthetase TilS [Xanthobacteraceae bacterium]|nr:tRNA lysidine(34) synthetase TilS [Xanthobacteraceae bacterium]
MSTAEAASRPLTAAECRTLFSPVAAAPAVVLAVSGGPDSTALLWLAAHWRARRKRGPKLLAVTVDHGLRPESAAEAREVGRLARRLGVTHRVMPWRGVKPKARLQEAARAARYRLLAQAADKIGATHVLTAHTRDDQAETVLMRFLRGSGPGGLGGMAPISALPVERWKEIVLFRPFLEIPKPRLVATLQAAGVAYAEDRSNRDPRFARVRMRALLPLLAEEGLTADRLVLLAQRVRRAEAALARAVKDAEKVLRRPQEGTAVAVDARGFAALPPEIGLRLLGGMVKAMATEGPPELAKLEALYAALPLQKPRRGSFRRTLAGAMITLSADRLLVQPAPARRGASRPLTTQGPGRDARRKMR